MSSLPISEFIQALVRAKLKFPEIRKSRTAKGKTFSYKYADISDILDAVYKPLAEEMIILNFKAVPDEKTGGETMNAVLTHISGHTFSSSGSIPRCQDAQELGSWKTYMRRYLACEVLGIQAEDDDDGAATKKNHDGNRGLPVTGGGEKTVTVPPPVAPLTPNAGPTTGPATPGAKITIGKPKSVSPDQFFTHGKLTGKKIDEVTPEKLLEWKLEAEKHFLKTNIDPETSTTDLARTYRAVRVQLSYSAPSSFAAFSGAQEPEHDVP